MGELAQNKGPFDRLGGSLPTVIDWVRGPGAAVAALVIAFVMVRAASAKLRSRQQTAVDFEALGLLAAGPLAVVVPAAELVTAALLVVVPGWGGVVAAALLAAFSVVIGRLLFRPEGLRPSCACFGAASRSPVSREHLVRNGVLGILALVAASSESAFNPILSPLFAGVVD